jgi:hypothetical protein
VIVVIGSPRARPSADGGIGAAGLASGIAIAAAGTGAPVQVVGRVGEDPPGEAILLDLAQRAVGHVAVLRDAGRPTRGELPSTSDQADEALAETADDPPGALSDEAPTIDAADLDLALRYLPEYRVIVVAEALGADALAVAADAARWSGSALVVVGRARDLAGLPDDATAFEPPGDGDPDGAFAALVGAYAAGLDRGDDPRAAFEAATAAVGSTTAG